MDKLINEFNDVRSRLRDALSNKVIFTEQQIDDMWDDDELSDIFYDLPDTPYTDKNGFTYYLKMISYKDGMFKIYDSETSLIHTVDECFVPTDSIVEFLTFQY